MRFMRIACPKCAAEYEVPASRLTPRKTVRCARCGGEWTAVGEAEELSPEVAATLSEQELDHHAELEEPPPTDDRDGPASGDRSSTTPIHPPRRCVDPDVGHPDGCRGRNDRMARAGCPRLASQWPRPGICDSYDASLSSTPS